MSSTMFWAADSIAQSISGARERAVSNSTLRKRQGFHAGDVAVQNCALEALHIIDLSHPLLVKSVSKRVFQTAEYVFYKRVWAAACALDISPAQILSELKSEFLKKRAAAILKTEAESIKKRRRGWIFLNRRNVWIWHKQEHPTEGDALAAKPSELQRLSAVQMGSTL